MGSKLSGIVVCVAVLVVAGLFGYGFYVQSYWAIAVPVILAVVGVLALGFWIGWTMIFTETEVPSPPLESPSEQSGNQ